MDNLFRPGAIIVLLGPGGVGKTTIAAALAIASAQAGLPTQVITVDPARRLRDALGLARVRGRPLRLNSRSLRAAGLDPALDLTAMTLDGQAVWDSFVARFITDLTRQRVILRNAFYRNLTANFPGAISYAALERMHQLHEEAPQSVTIVDTPPAAQALDFVEAPGRLADLLSAPSARWLFRFGKDQESRSLRLAGRLGRAVLRQLEHFAGLQALSTITEFFAAAADAIDPMTARMRAASRLLHSPAARFLLVTTAEPSRLDETREIILRLRRERLPAYGVIVNRAFENASQGDRGPLLSPQLKLQRHANFALERNCGALLDFLERHADGEQAAHDRIRGFTRELPPSLDLGLLPRLEAIEGLRGLACLAELLGNPELSPPNPARASRPRDALDAPPDISRARRTIR